MSIIKKIFGGGGGGGGGISLNPKKVASSAAKGFLQKTFGSDAAQESQLAQEAFADRTSNEDLELEAKTRQAIKDRLEGKFDQTPQEQEMQQFATLELAKRIASQRLQKAQESVAKRGLSGSPFLSETGAEDTAEKIMGMQLAPILGQNENQVKSLQGLTGFSGTQADRQYGQAQNRLLRGQYEDQKRMGRYATIGSIAKAGGSLGGFALGNMAGGGSSNRPSQTYQGSDSSQTLPASYQADSGEMMA